MQIDGNRIHGPAKARKLVQQWPCEIDSRSHRRRRTEASVSTVNPFMQSLMFPNGIGIEKSQADGALPIIFLPWFARSCCDTRVHGWSGWVDWRPGCDTRVLKVMWLESTHSEW